MPENCSVCGAIIPPTENNWGTDERPVCFDCWTELVDIADIFERETDLEVERRR